MAIYLVREVSRTPPSAQADRSTAPTPAAPPTRIATRVDDVTPPPVRIGTPNPPPAAPPIEHDRATQTPAIERVAPTGPNPKADAVMAEANRAYDQGDFEEAKQIAHKVLAQTPNNVRMLRIVVSSECIAGDSAEAQKYFTQLPAEDRAQMRTRCDRYGVTLKDP